MSKARSYDKHQFGGRGQHPVNARPAAAGGWTSSGVAFEDYARMSTQQHKPSGERRLPTPQWAVNDGMLRELLVVFMEERAGYRKRQTGPLLPRLERAKQAIISQRPRWIATLDKLCAEYVKLKRLGSDPSVDDHTLNLSLEQPLVLDEWARPWKDFTRKRQLEIEIEGIDTFLRYTSNGGADVIAAIVYLYYRAGLDSVGVGAELGLKPPHVRQTLWRLHDTWKTFTSQAQGSSGAANKLRANGEPADAQGDLSPLQPPPLYAILNQ